MTEQSPIDVVRHASTWSVVWGVLLVIAGMLAISAPMIAAIAVSILLAWLIVFAGIVHLVVAFHGHRAGSIIWKLLVGIAYLCFGAYLLWHPVLGVASLTLVIAYLYMIYSVMTIV